MALALAFESALALVVALVAAAAAVVATIPSSPRDRHRRHVVRLTNVGLWVCGVRLWCNRSFI